MSANAHEYVAFDEGGTTVYERACPTREDYQDRIVELEVALSTAIEVADNRLPISRLERCKRVLDGGTR